MEAQAAGNKLHPVLWIAAVAVIVLSAAGIAAIFGVIPTSGSAPKQAEPIAATAPVATPAPAPAAAAQSAEPAPAKPKPAPAKKVAAAKSAEPKALPKTETQPAQVAAQPAPPPAPAVCDNCGTIDSIVEKAQKGQGTGIGAVAGGVAGAVLGSQVGKGSGKTAATVIGAAGGAVAGHQAERYVRKTSKWEIIVRMEDGTAREFDVATQPVWRVGDKVKIDNNVIMAR